jgi:hypothetical protein
MASHESVRNVTRSRKRRKATEKARNPGKMLMALCILINPNGAGRAFTAYSRLSEIRAGIST